MPGMKWFFGSLQPTHDAAPFPGCAKHREPALPRVQARADILALLRQDLANVEAGIYPLRRDPDGSPLTRLYRSWLFFDDLPEVYHRRERNGFREALNETTRDRVVDYY